tara:strand:- start:849 stop:1256 length:408 start_codon:yes stop_codon:yes gene_type:complete
MNPTLERQESHGQRAMTRWILASTVKEPAAGTHQAQDWTKAMRRLKKQLLVRLIYSTALRYLHDPAFHQRVSSPRSLPFSDESHLVMEHEAFRKLLQTRGQDLWIRVACEENLVRRRDRLPQACPAQDPESMRCG